MIYRTACLTQSWLVNSKLKTSQVFTFEFTSHHLISNFKTGSHRTNTKIRIYLDAACTDIYLTFKLYNSMSGCWHVLLVEKLVHNDYRRFYLYSPVPNSTFLHHFIYFPMVKTPVANFHRFNRFSTSISDGLRVKCENHIFCAYISPVRNKKLPFIP